MRLKNKIVFGFILSSLPFIGNSQITINEYQCSNVSTLTDNFGEYEDWFELYNSSGADIDISGYFLSDKINNPTKWQIPSGVVPANGYLTVFANGEDGVNNGQVHTKFKLTQTKPEMIILSNTVGAIVDSVSLQPNQIDHSYGRSPDGAADWSVSTTPTPGASNGTGLRRYATTPVFSLAPGNYTSATTLSLSSPDGGVEIRYTLDGSEPDLTSPVYSAPINIGTTSVVRAKAYSTQGSAAVLPSFIETNTYFINENHSVKVVSICGGDNGGDGVMDLLLDNLGFFPGDDPIGSIELFDANFNLLTESTGDFNKHGNDSWAYDQRGFDYIARDQYGYNYAVENKIFSNKSRKKFQRLIFKAAASDNYPFEPGGAHIRDAFIQTLSQKGKLRLDERSFEPCVVYLDGQYWGVYEIREKVDDHDFTEYYYNQGRKDIDYIKTWGNTWAEYGTVNDWNNLYTFIITNNMAVQSNFDYVDSLFNWKSLVDYTVLNSYIVAKDWLNWNTGWWRGRNPNGDKKKWRYTLWDMDAVYGHYVNFTGIPDESMSANPCNPEQIDPFGDPEGHMQILNALIANDQVNQWYVSRYIDLGNTLFSCDYLINHLDSLVALIDPEMQAQCNRWGGTYNGWLANVQAFKDSINKRCVSIDSGLTECYNVVGPYPIVVDVSPSLAGDVKINSTTPGAYPFTGDYFGNIDIILEANPENGFMFSHWEIVNQPDSITIDSLSNPATFRIGQTDTVIAHFIGLDSVYMAFNVAPTGTGNISINGMTPSTYSYNDYFPTNSAINLIATPEPGYIFDYWESSAVTFNPNSNASTVSMSATQTDSITAHFKIDDRAISFNVSPANGGDISIDNVIPSSYIFTKNYLENDTVALIAQPKSGFSFSHWASGSTAFIAAVDSISNKIVVNQPDTILAYFIPDTFELVFDVVPASAGDLSINGSIPGNYAHTESFLAGTLIELVETTNTDYVFDHWQVNNHVVAPSNTDSEVNFVVGGQDSVIAVFTRLPDKGAHVPMAFSPNGDGNNDLLLVYGGQIQQMNLEIYDRWGKQVFATDNQLTGWDGTFKGNAVNSGVYFYKLKVAFGTGEEEVKSGNITLVR